MPTIEIGPGKGVGVVLPASERISALVSGPAHGGADTLVLLAVRIGELAASSAELCFDLPFRVPQLAL